jgi:hypothetical protein
VLVVAPDESVARWAARPVETGQPGWTFAPLVLGPGAVPIVTDRAVARAAPELAMLSVLSHGQGALGAEVAMAALSIVPALDEDTAVLYYDLIRSAVSAAVGRKLEELMRIEGYQYQSEFARKYYAKGRDEGRDEGREQGREQGRVEGQAEALLCILAARGLEVSESQRARILSCTAPSTLQTWLRRAVQIDHMDDLFT